MLGLDDGTLSVRNRYHGLDTSHLRFLAATLDGADGTPSPDVVLEVPVTAPGASAKPPVASSPPPG